MSEYDFSTQKDLFDIANQILTDYNIQEWSFGGGTALSYLYYQHRMSYDIDIFFEDYSAINRLVENREEIANNLGIPPIQVEASPTAITFILNTEENGLKLDFVFSPALTSEPYTVKDIFDYTDIKVQTPMEIIAKKLKHREKATIRDFVDYAIVEEQDQLLTKLKSEYIVDIDRYLDVVDKFNNFDTEAFNLALQDLMPNMAVTKDDLSPIINNIMTPGDTITVAVDNREVVAFDEFIEIYRSVYEEVGKFDIYTIENTGITYKEVLNLKRKEVLKLTRKTWTC